MSCNCSASVGAHVPGRALAAFEKRFLFLSFLRIYRREVTIQDEACPITLLVGFGLAPKLANGAFKPEGVHKS